MAQIIFLLNKHEGVFEGVNSQIRLPRFHIDTGQIVQTYRQGLDVLFLGAKVNCLLGVLQGFVKLTYASEKDTQGSEYLFTYLPTVFLSGDKVKGLLAVRPTLLKIAQPQVIGSQAMERFDNGIQIPNFFSQLEGLVVVLARLCRISQDRFNIT